MGFRGVNNKAVDARQCDALTQQLVIHGPDSWSGPCCKWLGKKDSNLRMLESKSSALTSLAIPQLIFGPVPKRMIDQTRANPCFFDNRRCVFTARYFTDYFLLIQQRLGSCYKLGKQTRTRTCHARMNILAG